MLLIAEFSQYFFGISISITSMFLVMLVLVQRGRGGGLTGALGGAGGQSAFGTKAGDLFTRITVGVATVWIFLCAAAVFFLKDRALPDTGVDSRQPANLSSTLQPGSTTAPSSESTSGASPAPAANTPASGGSPDGATPATTQAPAAVTPAAGTPTVGTPTVGTPAAGTPGLDAAPGLELAEPATPSPAAATPPVAAPPSEATP